MKNKPDRFRIGLDEYLKLIHKAKEKVDIPIVGSLNGSSLDGWTDYARLLE